MQKFNVFISVEVSVDKIAQKLLGTFPEGYQHAELLTETIIGTALDKGTIGYIHNALNGYNNDIDFKVGDVIECTKEVAQFLIEDGSDDRKRKWVKMGTAKVVDINLYTTDKLEVEYAYIAQNGEQSQEKVWVNHKTCTGVKEREAQLS